MKSGIAYVQNHILSIQNWVLTTFIVRTCLYLNYIKILHFVGVAFVNDDTFKLFLYNIRTVYN